MKSSLLLLMFFCTPRLFAQFEKIDQVTWGGRINNPITVEVIKSNGKLTFYANNSSYYQYRLDLEFKRLQNLGPVMMTHHAVLRPGRNRLFDLTILQANTPIDYQYATRYQFGNPDDRVDMDFPYLIPLQLNKRVEFFKKQSGQGYTKYRNVFSLSAGDTVTCMRRGTVTSLPGDDRAADQLFKGTIEVLHQDGTVATYHNVDPQHLLVEYGQKVLAGQDLGIISEGAPLRIGLFMFEEGGKIKSFVPKYAVDENVFIPASELEENTIVKHPTTILERELTKRELKKKSKDK